MLCLTNKVINRDGLCNCCVLIDGELEIVSCVKGLVLKYSMLINFFKHKTKIHHIVLLKLESN